MKRSTVGLAVMAIGLGLFVGCEEKLPNRDHIPLLRQKLYDLQVAVAAKSQAAIDSLLSVDILDFDQGSDSLLKYVYNHEGRYFAFERFGNYRIAYTNDAARIDCFLMDSTGTRERPIKLSLVFEHDMWLLKRFEPGSDVDDAVNDE